MSMEHPHTPARRIPRASSGRPGPPPVGSDRLSTELDHWSVFSPLYAGLPDRSDFRPPESPPASAGRPFPPALSTAQRTDMGTAPTKTTGYPIPRVNSRPTSARSRNTPSGTPRTPRPVLMTGRRAPSPASSPAAPHRTGVHRPRTGGRARPRPSPPHGRAAAEHAHRGRWLPSSQRRRRFHGAGRRRAPHRRTGRRSGGRCGPGRTAARRGSEPAPVPAPAVARGPCPSPSPRSNHPSAAGPAVPPRAPDHPRPLPPVRTHRPSPAPS